MISQLKPDIQRETTMQNNAELSKKRFCSHAMVCTFLVNECLIAPFPYYYCAEKHLEALFLAWCLKRDDLIEVSMDTFRAILEKLGFTLFQDKYGVYCYEGIIYKRSEDDSIHEFFIPEEVCGYIAADNDFRMEKGIPEHFLEEEIGCNVID